jgi:hypothetical protein
MQARDVEVQLMTISELKHTLQEARARAEQGHADEAAQLIEQALRGLEETLLTTTQAKEWLGIGSVNTLKLLVRRAGLRTEMHGNRMMIPLSELTRLQGSDELRGIYASDRLHAAAAGLGSEEGLTHDELERLDASRPGTLPWRDT